MIAPLTHGNARVKEARKLSRRPVRTGRRLFLADGPKAVAGALSVDGCVVEVFATPEATEQHADLATRAARWSLVDARALASLSDSVNPAGVVAVCRFLDRPLGEVLPPAGEGRGPRLVVICDEVRDPGNAGTVIRTADAAGADAVVLAGTSVDPYHPRTVRASVGSIFHLPLVVAPDPLAVVRVAEAAGLGVLAADAAGELDLYDADEQLARPTAWLFGNEARGLPAALAGAAHHRVRIPIHGRAESLNLATAAALCLYASARAHRG